MTVLFQDQHLHSRHSFDSNADPVANVQTAIDKGLSGLIFTEHFDIHPDDWKECVYNDTAYTETIQILRRDFGTRLFIGKGIEICFQPDHMAFILDFLDHHEFDMVMLSVHYAAGQAIHHRDLWQSTSPEEMTRQYLQNVLCATQFCRELRKNRGRVFDVLGHLDLAKRYTQRFFNTYSVTPFGDLLDEILRTCLDADLIPEINTSSLRQGLQESMPGPDTVLRYARLGGRAMSVGSDSHRSEDIGAGFDVAASMLRAVNLRAAVFQARQCEFISP
ncbi:MAG: histidinol-phosphatase HisJ family protein [Planctomycetota bacterium]